MNGLKISVSTLALTFSLGGLAADKIDRNTERDRVFNNSRDCAGITGADKALCDKEIKSDSTYSKSNQNLGIN